MSSLKKQSFKAILWELSGKFAGQTVSFVISIFLARLLTPEDFGLIAMVNVVIALSTSLIDMGLGVAIIQRKDVNDAHYGSVFYFNITVGIVLTSILFFSAPAVATFYEKDILIPMTRVMSFLFLTSSIGNVIRVKLRKELEYGILTQAKLLGAIVSGGVGVSMAFTGFGVWSLVTQALLSPTLNNIYLFYRVKWRPRLIFKWKALKELWSFGFRMFISGVIDSIATNIDTLIIGKLFSSGTLGYYNRAKSLNNYVITYSANSFMNVLFPALSKIQDNEKKFVIVVEKIFHIINFIAFYLTGIFIVIGDSLILFLFGDKWAPAIPYFHLIILNAYNYPLSSLLVNILKAKGDSKAFLRLEIIKKIASVLALSLGFFWGIKGYLICKILVNIYTLIVNIIFVAPKIDVKYTYFLKLIFPYVLLVAFVSGGLFWGIGYFELKNLYKIVIGAFLFTSFYMGGAWVLKLNAVVYIKSEINEYLTSRNKSRLL